MIRKTLLFGLLALCYFINCNNETPSEPEGDTDEPVQIVSPTNGLMVADLVDILVVATDDKGITKVEVFVDTVSIGVDLTSPYEFQWDAHTFEHNSEHIIHAQATDTDDNVVGSPLITCFIDTSLANPTQPNIISVTTNNDNSYDVTWNSNSDNDFQGYIVWTNTSLTDIDTGERSSLITNREDTMYHFDNLLDNQEYFFRIIVYDIFDHQSYSDHESVLTTNSNPPSIFLHPTLNFEDKVILRWDESNAHDFLQYKIYRSLNISMENDLILLANINESDSNVYIDYVSDSSITYYYAVKVIDNGGSESISNVQSGKLLPNRFALKFTGNNYCEIPHYNDIDFVNDALTIEAWAYVTTYTQYSRVIDKGSFQSNPYFQYSLNVNNDNIGSDYCLGINHTRLTGHTILSLNTWYHLAITYNSDSTHFYVNGVLDRSFPTANTSFCDFPTPLNIGRRKLFNEYYFNGYIDEVRIWNYARSGDDILNNYNKVLSESEVGLVGYWRFDEGWGDNIIAVVGNNGRLGSLSGADDNDPEWINSTAPISY